MSASHATPRVLCVSGLDPSGGAGIAADIAACQALGAHALPVITALTAQDTRDVRFVDAVAPETLERQLDVLLADCQPDAVKLGLLGSAEQVAVIVRAIEALRVPVVVDPVLRAGGGFDLADAALLAALDALLPRIALLTPNAAEARRLAPAATLAESARMLLYKGCANVLVTGGDENDDDVVNRWYAPAAAREYRWPRHPEVFHGAGCTLAAGCAALLARGMTMADAIQSAQAYVAETLARALRVGGGRRIPGRS